jgi:hypothetical protein
MSVHGTSFGPNVSSTYRYTFDHQHASDELFFLQNTVGDAAADYTHWLTWMKAPHVDLNYDLSHFEPHKEVALTFRFDALTESRVLVYTDAGLLDEEILHVGDDQFLIEVESTDALYLRFIHVNHDAQSSGGNWYFRGIDGYIA